MYINNQYTHHRPDHSIRIASHQHEAQTFLKNKYRWSSKVFHSINWDSHGACLLTLSASLKRSSLRFSHHRLPTGKMVFTSPNSCPYYKSQSTPSSPHDHFLMCSYSSIDKHIRLNSIQKKPYQYFILLHYCNTIFSYPYQKYITSTYAPLNIHFRPQYMHQVISTRVYSPNQ